MGLCFFSLASSVSANIYDQSKEISVMRSCGMTTSYILRLFIYESLILVLSCSLCGFIIGISIGNLMILQQCKITSSPYSPQYPFSQLYTMVGCSLLLALVSTYGTASKILGLSIPDI